MRPRIARVPAFEIATGRKTELVEVTGQVREALADARAAAAVLVYVPHTTAGVVVQERADPAVARDVERALARIVAEGWDWEHVEAGEANAPSHVRSALTATSVVIPLHDGDLALGRWQGVFLCEFDGPRRRTVSVTPLS
jgi:secondary thiamine-phosphate synthase enzyme